VKAVCESCVDIATSRLYFHYVPSYFFEHTITLHDRLVRLVRIRGTEGGREQLLCTNSLRRGV